MTPDYAPAPAAVYPLEPLESRRMLSVSLHGSTLTLDGTPGDDTLSVYARHSKLMVNDNGQLTALSATNAATILTIVMNGGTGNDTLQIGAGVATRAILNGGAGDDTLIGGDGNDTLLGGAGNDLLEGLGGDDVLFGDSGQNRLYGGDGDDTISGGAGDVIRGQAGVNTLISKLPPPTHSRIGIEVAQASDLVGTALPINFAGSGPVSSVQVTAGASGTVADVSIHYPPGEKIFLGAPVDQGNDVFEVAAVVLYSNPSPDRITPPIQNTGQRQLALPPLAAGKYLLRFAFSNGTVYDSQFTV